MLAFIGFIALLIFGKFLYDTYVTGKTDKDWESYKKNEPEKAARITNSATFDMSTDYKPNSMHQQASLNMIAAQLECEASEAKETYQKVIREDLAIDFGNIEKFKEQLKEARQHKYKQAISMQFDPNNTPAAFMEGWLQEVIAKFIQPEMSVERIISKAHSLTCKHEYKDALDLLSASYEMIQTGKLVDNNNLMPFLLNAIGESHLSLEDNSKAWFFFSMAISHLEKTSPDNEEARNQFLLNKENAESNAASVAESVLAEFDREMRAADAGIKNVEQPKMSAKVYLSQATELASKNQHEAALKLISDAISILVNGELNGDELKLVKVNLINLRGECQLELGEFKEAKSNFNRASMILHKVGQKDEELLNKIIVNWQKAEDCILAEVEKANAVAAAAIKVKAAQASIKAKLAELGVEDDEDEEEEDEKQPQAKPTPSTKTITDSENDRKNAESFALASAKAQSAFAKAKAIIANTDEEEEEEDELPPAKSKAIPNPDKNNGITPASSVPGETSSSKEVFGAGDEIVL